MYLPSTFTKNMSGVNNKSKYHTSEEKLYLLVGEQSVLVPIADKIRCQLSTKWLPKAKKSGDEQQTLHDSTPVENSHTTKHGLTYYFAYPFGFY